MIKREVNAAVPTLAGLKALDESLTSFIWAISGELPGIGLTASMSREAGSHYPLDEGGGSCPPFML